MSDQAAKRERWPWFIFGCLLGIGLASYCLSFDWTAGSWLDRAAVAISGIGLVGVLLYATRSTRLAGRFWLSFRWLFIGVAMLQTFTQALEIARQRGFATGGTIAFMTVIAVVIGWVYVLQWIAMTRLAAEGS